MLRPTISFTYGRDLHHAFQFEHWRSGIRHFSISTTCLPYHAAAVPYLLPIEPEHCMGYIVSELDGACLTLETCIVLWSNCQQLIFLPIAFCQHSSRTSTSSSGPTYSRVRSSLHSMWHHACILPSTARLSILSVHASQRFATDCSSNLISLEFGAGHIGV